MALETTLTLGEIADGLVDKLSEAASIKRVESWDGLTEGIPTADLPLLQCYWQDWNMDPTGQTDRLTFQAGMRHKVFTFHVDLYAAQRSHIAEDFKQMHDSVSELIDIFEAQDLKDYFDTLGIKAWSVSAERVIFQYEGTEFSYVGARFIITVHLF